MDYAEIAAECESKIDELRKKIKSLNTQLTKQANKRDAALLELNKNNFSSMEWLIKNPTLPGSHEALSEMMKNLYGGEWNGVHPSGYTHDGKYNPIQKNFEFNCRVYSKDKDAEVYKNNIRHFVENYVQFFEPLETIESRWSNKFPKVNVVGFQFMSRSSGLDYLGYDPEHGDWYHYTVRYSKPDIERKFENFDAALAFAFDYVEAYGDDD